MNRKEQAWRGCSFWRKAPRLDVTMEEGAIEHGTLEAGGHGRPHFPCEMLFHSNPALFISAIEAVRIAELFAQASSHHPTSLSRDALSSSFCIRPFLTKPATPSRPTC